MLRAADQLHSGRGYVIDSSGVRAFYPKGTSCGATAHPSMVDRPCFLYGSYPCGWLFFFGFSGVDPGLGDLGDGLVTVVIPEKRDAG